MSNKTYLPESTLHQIYETSQSLSGVAPIDLNYQPSFTHTFADPKFMPQISDIKATVEVKEEKDKDESNKKPQTVDPMIFSILLTNETNLKLKKSFGISFIVITCVFTLISYGIIVFASIYEWKLPAVALTALIVQAPLQMVGILYIMAKSLFPTTLVPSKKEGKQG